jgi:hypothetical protein
LVNGIALDVKPYAALAIVVTSEERAHRWNIALGPRTIRERLEKPANEILGI